MTTLPSPSDSGHVYSLISSDLAQLAKAAERGEYTTSDWQAYARYLDQIDAEIAAGNIAEALRLSELSETLGFESNVKGILE